MKITVGILIVGFLLATILPHANAQESPDQRTANLSIGDLQARMRGREIAIPSNSVLAASEVQTAKLRSGNHDYRAFMKRTPIEDAHDIYPPAEVVSFSYELVDGGSDPSRPVIFLFNGGPGSASIWLHMAGFGPDKTSAEFVGGPSGDVTLSRAVNDGFLIDVADLVFVDPVGTGLSRVTDGDDDRKFRDLRVDARAMCRFAQNWLASENRVGTPVYVLGVSYSTLRAAGMASHNMCSDFRENLRGLIFVSGLLDLRMRHPRDATGRMSVFPTIAAIAWNRGLIDRNLWPGGLDAFLEEMETYARDTVRPALIEGHLLAEPERRAIINELNAKLGLTLPSDTITTIAAAIQHARRNVDGSSTACGYDARFDCDRRFGFHPNLPLLVFGEQLETDLAADLSRVFDYELATDHYTVMREDRFRTNWDYRFHKSSDRGAGTDMAHTLVKKIKLPRPIPGPGEIASLNDLAAYFKGRRPADKGTTRIMVVSGLHDLVTPYYAMELALINAGLEPSQFEMHLYEGGHMMYLEKETGYQLAADIRSFILSGEKRF